MGSMTFPEPNEPPLRDVSHVVAVVVPELVVLSACVRFPDPKLPPFRLGRSDAPTGEPASVQEAKRAQSAQAVASVRRRYIGDPCFLGENGCGGVFPDAQK
jgi:hypothetical protein